MSLSNSNAPTVVFHADDFGMSAAVNGGILRSFRDGILTSTSILANGLFAADACAAWPRLIDDLRAGSLPSADRRRHLGDELRPFDIGVHLNLTEGSPLSGQAYPASLLNDQGHFPGATKVFRLLRTAWTGWRDSVRTELKLQIEWILDHGIRPTQLNGHQYVELIPGIAELVPELMERYSIPVVRIARERHLVRTVLMKGRIVSFGIGLVKQYFAQRFQTRMLRTGFVAPDRYFGTSHAGHVDLPALRLFLRYANQSGCTEICLHPGDEVDGRIPQGAGGWFDPFRESRPLEAGCLCGEIVPQIMTAKRLKLGRLSDLRP